MYIDNNGHIALEVTIMEGRQSLTLHWRSFSWWGRDHFTFSFAYKDSQYFVYDDVQPIALQTTRDTWPRIFDAALTLILLWGRERFTF